MLRQFCQFRGIWVLLTLIDLNSSIPFLLTHALRCVVGPSQTSINMSSLCITKLYPQRYTRDSCQVNAMVQAFMNHISLQSKRPHVFNFYFVSAINTFAMCQFGVWDAFDIVLLNNQVVNMIIDSHIIPLYCSSKHSYLYTSVYALFCILGFSIISSYMT